MIESKPMISRLRFSTVFILHVLLATSAPEGSPVSVGDSVATETNRLSLALQPATGSPDVRPRESVRWNEREYDLDSGIEVIMNAFRKSAQDAHERELALIQLAMLRAQLQRRACLQELQQAYDEAGDVEKQLILTCFLGSRDPRAIPLFVRTLEDEENMKLRLAAAAGLAAWNVRRGVAALVGLLESEETLKQPARMPYARDNAMESFRKANMRNGWGFASKNIGDAIAFKTELNGEQEKALYIAEIKKWWAANERRFPDWKPGDRLPEITESRVGKTAEE